MSSSTTNSGTVFLATSVAWVDAEALRAAAPDAEWLEVDAGEPRGANHLLVDGAVLSPASCPRTVERLRARGIDVAVVDVSELEKAEAGVTCSSLVFDTPAS